MCLDLIGSQHAKNKFKMSKLNWPPRPYPSCQHPSWQGIRTFHKELFVKEVKGACIAEFTHVVAKWLE